jgi:hypothetical protein
MGDFFNRKGLLSDAQRAKIPKPLVAERSEQPADGGHPAIAPPALPVSQVALRNAEHEVFQRATVVPEVPAEAHAKELMSALDAAGAAPKSDAPAAGVSLSFTSMELALDENPTTLGFVEVQKGRHQSGEIAQRDANLAQAPAQRDPQPSANIDELYELGDFSAALEAAEARLQLDPQDGVALGYRNRCRDKLLQMLLARLGRLDA